MEILPSEQFCSVSGLLIGASDLYENKWFLSLATVGLVHSLTNRILNDSTTNRSIPKRILNATPQGILDACHLVGGILIGSSLQQAMKNQDQTSMVKAIKTSFSLVFTYLNLHVFLPILL